MTTRLLLPWLCVAPVLAVDWTQADFGAQPVAIGAGARALGMGGAFSAVADDASAVTWNPAGLTRCERPEVALSLGAYHTRVRSDDGTDDGAETLRLDHLSAMLPFFALGCQQVVGVSWQRQYDFARRLTLDHSTVAIWEPDIVVDTTQRQEIDQSGSFASLGASYAVEVIPTLSLGVSLHAWKDAWTRASHLRRDSHERDDTVFSAVFSNSTYLVDSWSDTRVVDGINWQVGAFWQAAPTWTVALVVKPGYDLELERSTRLDTLTDDGGFITTTSDQSTTRATLHHPSSYTAGLAWHHDDEHILALDATLTRWGEYHQDDAAGRHSPVHYLLAPDDFDDLWTLRLGYERVLILPRVVLVPRVGLLMEDLPAVTRATSLSAIDAVRATSDRWWGATTGFSLCQRQVIYDLGVQVRWGDNIGSGQWTSADSTADALVVTGRAGVTVQF